MKLFFLKSTLVLCLGIVMLSSCQLVQQNEDVNKNFHDIYDRKKTLAEYCGEHNDYMINIDIEKTSVKLVLKRDDDHWSGQLSLYNESNKIEEIPLELVNDEIVIQSATEERVPSNILFFTQIDMKKNRDKRIKFKCYRYSFNRRSDRDISE